MFTGGLAGIALLAGFVGLRQLLALVAARHWDTAEAIMSELRSEDRIELQSQLWNSEFEPARIERHPRMQEFSLLVSRQQWISIMLESKAIPFGLVMKLIGSTPSQTWYMLGQHVEKRNKVHPPYGRKFRRLVQLSLQWHMSREPREEWPTLDRPSEGGTLDLVPILVSAGMLTPNEVSWAKFHRWLRAIYRPSLRMSKEQWLGIEVTSSATSDQTG